MTSAPGRRDQRKHARKTALLAVTVGSLDGPRVDGGIELGTSNLSSGGAFVRAELLFEQGELLKMDVRLPSGKVVKATARVVRVSREEGDGAGMGIEFVHLSDEDRRALNLALSVLKAS